MNNPSDNKTLDLNQLVEEHFDYLYRYAFRYFRSEELAQDLVQETFLAATQAVKRFAGNSSPRTWLTSILRHKIMDQLKKKNREEPTDFQSLENDSLPPLFDKAEHWHKETGPIGWNAAPDANLNQKQFLSILDSCLNKLPAKMRQIFLLREIDGLERDDICTELNLTSSNVGVLLHRARLSLQSCLQTNWLNTSRGET